MNERDLIMDKSTLDKLITNKNLSILIVIFVMAISFGYAAFNSVLNITGTYADVRIKQDIRITGIRTNSATSSGSSTYEDYNKSSIKIGTILPNSNSTITYEVDITNLGNTEMGIYQINNLPSNLEYSLSDYEEGTKLCVDTKCSLGVTKTIKITIKYKNNGFNSTTTTYNLKLDFDFQRFYNVTYNTKTGANKSDSAIGKGTYVLDFSKEEAKPNSVSSIKMAGSNISNYSYNSSTGILSIPNVTGDIQITASYKVDCLKASPRGSGDYYSNSYLDLPIKRKEIEAVTFNNTKLVPEGLSSYDVSEDGNGSILAYYLDEDNNGLYELYIGQDGGVKANKNSEWLFAYFKNLKNINLKYLDTSEVTNMYYLFLQCESLTTLDVSTLITDNVTNMVGMFSTCKNLTSLDLSNFNTINVNNMSEMFYQDYKLSNLNVSYFNTEKVTQIRLMFSYCSSLTSLDITNFITKKVNNMDSTFKNCSSLESLDLSNFTTEKVSFLGNLFSYCEKLNNLNIRNDFVKSNITNIKAMFNSCKSLTTLDLSQWDTSNVTDMSNLFNHCDKLTSLNFYNINTNKVTNMSSFFSYCSALPESNLVGIVSKFNTINVTDMSYMFHWCTQLNNLDLSHFNTENVTTMSYMFFVCSNLSTLNISSFNTSNVTNMAGMFYNFRKMDTINLSHFDTSKVTSMYDMFANSSYKSLDISNFDLSSLKSMGEMFAYNRLLTSININGIDTSNVTNMKRLFRECESLENINIRHFKTANVTDMSEMFYKCTNLKTINIASTTFEFKKEYDEATQTTNFLVTVTNMFAECPNLQKLYIYDILQMAILNQIYPGFTSLPFEPIQDGEPS